MQSLGSCPVSGSKRLVAGIIKARQPQQCIIAEALGLQVNPEVQSVCLKDKMKMTFLTTALSLERFLELHQFLCSNLVKRAV